MHTLLSLNRAALEQRLEMQEEKQHRASAEELFTQCTESPQKQGTDQINHGIPT